MRDRNKSGKPHEFRLFTKEVNIFIIYIYIIYLYSKWGNKNV